MKIKEGFEKLFKKAKTELDDTYDMIVYDIQCELDEISILQQDIATKWDGIRDENAEKPDPEVLKAYENEIERRTKRVYDLLGQLEKVKELKKVSKKCEKDGLTAGEIFRGAIYIGGICLVLYAEESRPLISKAMQFVCKPKL